MEGVGAYKIIVDRPLFAANRRPPAPPPKDPVAKKRPSLDGIALFGVAIGPEGGVALMRVPKLAKPLDVAVGQTVAGWRLDKVLPDRILLSADDETAEIRIRKASQTKNGGRPARPRARPPKPPLRRR